MESSINISFFLEAILGIILIITFFVMAFRLKNIMNCLTFIMKYLKNKQISEEPILEKEITKELFTETDYEINYDYLINDSLKLMIF